MRRIFLLFLVALIPPWTTAWSGTQLIYLQQEVRPSAIWGFMPPWDLPRYMANGPFLITRGTGFNEIHRQGNAQVAACTGFVAGDNRFIHGTGELALQSWGPATGISLVGPARTASHYLSGGYVDYFGPGDDIMPWKLGNALVLEANAIVPFARYNGGDVGYVQCSLLLEDTASGKLVWWVWQVYDNRPDIAAEFVGVDITPDGGGYPFVVTTFGDNLLYSTLRPGTNNLQHAAWSGFKWFASRVTRGNLSAGIAAIRASSRAHSDLSIDPAKYRVRAFNFYPELYLRELSSTARICTASQGALLRID